MPTLSKIAKIRVPVTALIIALAYGPTNCNFWNTKTVAMIDRIMLRMTMMPTPAKSGARPMSSMAFDGDISKLEKRLAKDSFLK
jgi:hypothetical protein